MRHSETQPVLVSISKLWNVDLTSATASFAVATASSTGHSCGVPHDHARSSLTIASPRTLRVVVLPLPSTGVRPGRRKIAAEQFVINEDALPSHVVFEFGQ